MYHFETDSTPPGTASWNAGSASSASTSTSTSSQPPRTPWQTFEHTYPALTSTDTLFADSPLTDTPAQETAAAATTSSENQNAAAGPSVLARGITISGWSITASKGPIANSAQMDTISSELGIPPPEMLFPSNSLVITHANSGFTYTFDAVRALSSVHGVHSARSHEGMDLREEYERGLTSYTAAGKRLGSKPKSKGIKVSYAQEWGKGRTDLPAASANAAAGGPTLALSARASIPTSEAGSTSSPTSFFGPGVAQAIASAAAANESSDIASARDYDWTYSNTWAGLSHDPTETAQGSSRSPGFQPASHPVLDRIPIEKLGAGSEPILFYDEVVLYHDELADNGDSMLSVKVRVMPSGFLVLQRFLLRVDNVLFRMFDTRMYASFEPSTSTAASASRPAGPVASVYGATARPPAGRNGASIPTMAPTRFPGSSSGAATLSSSNAGQTALAQGINKLSLGPTRRQMKEAAAAAASDTSSETSSSPVNRTAPFVIATSGADANSNRASDLAAESKTSSRSQLRIIRECAGWEASYNEVKAKLPPYKAWDLSPLTDPNWIASTLQSLKPGSASNDPLRTATPAPYGAGAASLIPGRAPGAQIVGVVDEDKWEGVGSRVDVALLPYAP
ncbi:Tap42 interacting protein [Tilletia horrida]|uniref:Tap42 interacting protein n=1 Tax=Tilletia horrida TaxID=155126 RepID=A0AAN6GXA5_9BASI|nr:Tap42 interacting protein [Tilletia horrida]